MIKCAFRSCFKATFAVCILYILVTPNVIHGLSGIRLCADPQCEKLISTGITVSAYQSGEKGMLSFKPSVEVEIFSKGAGKNGDLWEVKVGGRRGYANQGFLREQKISVADAELKFKVPVTSLVQSKDIERETLNSVAAENAKRASPMTPHNIYNEIELNKFNEQDPNLITNTPYSTVATETTKNGPDLKNSTVPHFEVNDNVTKNLINQTSATLEKSEEFVRKTPRNKHHQNKAREPNEQNRSHATIVSPKIAHITTSENLTEANSKRFTVEVFENDTMSARLNNPNSQPNKAAVSTLSVESSDNVISNMKDYASVTPGNSEESNDHNQIKFYQQTEQDTKLKSSVSRSALISKSNKSDSKSKHEELVTFNSAFNTTAEILEKRNKVTSALGTNTKDVSVNKKEVAITQQKSNKEKTKTQDLLSSKNMEKTAQKKSASSEDISNEPTHVSMEADKLKNGGFAAYSNDNISSIGDAEKTIISDNFIAQSVNVFDDAKKESENEINALQYNSLKTVESTAANGAISSINLESSKSSTNGNPERDSSHRKLDSNTESILQDEKTFSNINNNESLSVPKDDERTHNVLEPPVETTNLGNEASDYSSSGITSDQQSKSSKSISTMEIANLEQPLELLDTETSSKINKVEYKTETPTLDESGNSHERKKIISKTLKDNGLFSTIMDTVNYFPKNDEQEKALKESQQGIRKQPTLHFEDFRICRESYQAWLSSSMCYSALFSELVILADNVDKFYVSLLITCIIVGISCIGYCCFSGNGKNSDWLQKLNVLERNLITSYKQNVLLNHELNCAQNKLLAIEGNTSEKNNIVADLNRDLRNEKSENERLKAKILSLQKDLEMSTEAGFELNKILSEMLVNQKNDESIVSSMEQLRSQIDEQKAVINDVNASLAERSQENSDLQQTIAELDIRLRNEIDSLKEINKELESQKSHLESDLEQIKKQYEEQIDQIMRDKKIALEDLHHSNLEITSKFESEYFQHQRSISKIEALENCLRKIKKDPEAKITEIINIVDVHAELLDTKKQYTQLKAKLTSEIDAKRLLESQFEAASVDLEKLKLDCSEFEKNKLEAQTRLEILSNYFKEKEMQLQKELNEKEAFCLKEQGETADTVHKMTSLQEEIRSLRSQNDALCAEIEAQVAAHKSQILSIENRERESWIEARAANRRYEQAAEEALILRRRLTAMASANEHSANMMSIADPNSDPNKLTINLDAVSPPPFPFMPQPFHTFYAPPNFQQDDETSSAILPPLMYPPPVWPPPMNHLKNFPKSDYGCTHNDDESDDESTYSSQRRYKRRQRKNYSPAPRTYRSLSPSEIRCEQSSSESDHSPPPSPRPSHRSDITNEV